MYFVLCSNGTVSRHSKKTWHSSIPITVFLGFFSNVHIKVSPSVVHNWHTYFVTKEAEELKVVFPNLTSVSGETDFQTNSGQIQHPSTMMPMDVFQ